MPPEIDPKTTISGEEAKALLQEVRRMLRESERTTLPRDQWAGPPIERLSGPSLVVAQCPESGFVGKRFGLTDTELSLGRASDCTVVVPDDLVSRRHAALSRTSIGWYLEDLGSRNGTFLNENPVQKEPVGSGAIIRIGGTVFLVHLPSDKRRTLASRLDEMPFPLAYPKVMVAAQPDSYKRLKSALDAIECALKFLVAVQIASLRAGGDTDAWQFLAGLLGPLRNRLLSLGTWEDLAWNLSRRWPGGGSDPIARCARALGSEGRRSELAERLQRVVALRNSLVHGTMKYDDSYEDDERVVRDLLDDVLTALLPLTEFNLVSVENIVRHVNDEEDEYLLRIHRGPLDAFQLQRRLLPVRLSDGWCAFLPTKGERPLKLEPFVLTDYEKARDRVGMFVTEEITLLPRAMVGLRSVQSGQVRRCEVRASQSELEFVRTLYPDVES